MFILRYIWIPTIINLIILGIMHADYNISDAMAEEIKRGLASNAILLVISLLFLATTALFGPTQQLICINEVPEYVISSSNSEIEAEAADEDETETETEAKAEALPEVPSPYYINKNVMRYVNGENQQIYVLAANELFPKFINGYVIKKQDGTFEYINKRMYFNAYLCGKRDALRTVRQKYPTIVIGEHDFDLDDEFNPYEIFVYREKRFSSDGNDYGIIILNLLDGSCEKYPASENDIPSWVDFKSSYPR